MMTLMCNNILMYVSECVFARQTIIIIDKVYRGDKVYLAEHRCNRLPPVTSKRATASKKLTYVGEF